MNNLEKKTEKMCKCGCSICRNNISEHKKSQKPINLMNAKSTETTN